MLQLLTIVTTAMVPAQFLSGLYGMNFRHMPETEYKYSYPIWWAVVLCSIVAVLFMFRRNIGAGGGSL